MNNKDKYIEIEKMLNFLKLNTASKKEYIVENIYNVPNEDYKRADVQVVIIDFKNKSCRWEAENVSGHNGDYYNVGKGNLSWDFILTGYDSLIKQSKEKFKQNIIQEKEKAKQDALKAEDKAINKTANRLIKELLK